VGVVFYLFLLFLKFSYLSIRLLSLFFSYQSAQWRSRLAIRNKADFKIPISRQNSRGLVGYFH